MKVWYYDIPAGEYTTQEIIEMSFPTQTYHAVYHTFRRLKVESYRTGKDTTLYNKRNEKMWIWQGAEYYLRMKEKKNG